MTPNASLLRAIAWMIGALTSFAAMTVSIRELTGEMHAFQMLFIRSAIGVLILLPIITGRWHGTKSAREGWRQIRRRSLPGSSAEHTSELQSLMPTPYPVFVLNKNK